MTVLGLTIGRLTDERLHEFRASDVTYEHVGSTLERRTELRTVSRVLTGSDAFDRARDRIRNWGPQRSIGARIFPAHVRPDLDETVVLGIGVSRAQLLVPNRIVAVVDEPDRYGYAYGTLPGHPECGEESFVVEREPTGRVTATICVDARPIARLSRLAVPINALQGIALRRYLGSTG